MAGSKRSKKKATTSQLPPEIPPQDDDLADALFAQLDAGEEEEVVDTPSAVSDSTPNHHHHHDAQPQTQSDKLSSRSRFDARKARQHEMRMQSLTATVDAGQEARIQQEIQEEKDVIYKLCNELGVVIQEIAPDGHCLFAAIADQLYILGLIPLEQAYYPTTRKIAAEYISSHANYFLPFLPSIGGEDAHDASEGGMMSPEGLAAYCKRIESTGAWGGEPEILALSRAYQVTIQVIQSTKPFVVSHIPGKDVESKGIARISYHRRMYGLGEHYNSLRPAPPATMVAS